MNQLRDGLFAVGVINPTLRVFDIIMSTEYGTTYNAYLIKDEICTLVETVHERFFDDYLAKISELCDPSQIGYIIFNHTEPDHSGSLRRLLEINPNIVVVGSGPAIKNLNKIVNRPFESMVVKDGDTLTIGTRTLQFVIAPNLHWPDSMFTYSPHDQTVFTCDFLGAHYCEEAVIDQKIRYPQKYRSAFQNYYNAIFSPFKKFVLAGLDKLDKLSFDMACTSHGPVLTEFVGEAMRSYRQWSTKTPSDQKSAVIVYVSAYGYTDSLANLAAKRLEAAGYKVQTFDLVLQSADVEAAMESDLLLIGSPTINRDALKPIWDFISSLDAVNISGKTCGVFGSYGWSGEAVPMLCSRLRELKLKVAGEGCRVQFRPDDADVKRMEDYLDTVIG